MTNWTPSRRQVLGMGVATGALVATSSLVAPAEAVPAAPRPRHRRGGPTTLDRTLLRGQPGPGGYRPIVIGAGEPHLQRDDLVGPGRRSGHRRAILALGQLTDMHILDAQSPARVEFLDRFNDPDSPFAGVLPFDSSYRTQDMLTAHVGEAMVQALNAVRYGPATGLPLAFTIATGDNVDNTQYNELRWQIDILDGERVRPDSGDLTKYEGVADLVDYDVRYWHPDGTPPGGADDLPRARFGFPTLPGLLDAARRPFHATGLRTPWLTTFGNHDGLVQGNLPSTPIVAGLATGNIKISNLPPGVDIVTLALGLLSGDPAALQTLFAGPARIVTADQARRPLSRTETIAEHFHTSAHPRGHGYSTWNVRTGNAYYAFDQGIVRGLVLDTVNPFGGADGSIDETQLGWLTSELTKGSRHYLGADGNVVRGGHRDRLFVLFSHHTIGTMTNGAGTGRVLGPALRDLLLRFPNVILWVNGHTHRNTVIPYRRSGAVPGGFWEINTAAHIDWPQQARVIEIVDNRNGTLSVFGTLIDHDAPRHYGSTPRDPLALAALSRELGANDWQNAAPTPTEDGRRGAVEDRNVELLLPAPFVQAH
ncbi:MAG TPA: TIGR03767 family metallophosphoesterase [Jatrophihabitantaceae bacterium]